VYHVSNGQFAASFLLGAAAGIAVFFHADRRGVRNPSLWASFVFLALPIGLTWYLIHVRRLRRR
jgi:phage shock protein PspC (stress-responsive transcriptional regulator)